MARRRWEVPILAKMILAGLLPLGAFAAYAILDAREDLETHTRRNLAVMLQNATHAVGRDVQAAELLGRTIARSGSMQEALEVWYQSGIVPAELVGKLGALSRDNPFCWRLQLFGRGRQKIADTAPTAGSRLTLPDGAERDTTWQATDGRASSWVLFHAIHSNQDGEVLGYVAIYTSLNRVFRSVAALLETEEEPRYGIILDEQERLLFHPDPDLRLRPAEDAQLSSELIADLHRRPRGTWIPARINGAATLVTGLGVDGTGWMTALVVPAEVASGTTLDLISLLLSLVGAVVVMALLTGAAFWRYVIAPISKLHASVGAFRDGHADRVEVRGGSSIGHLASSYNELIETVSSKEEHLRQKIVEAEASSRAKSEFLANMSHEIRTPMNAILGFSEMLEETDPEDSERHSHIAAIQRNGRHLLQIISDVLDLSKIEAGKIELEKVACDLPPILHDIEDYGALATRKGLDFRCSTQDGLPDRILTDPTRLRQVLANLIGNAAKFTEHGSVEVEVARSADGLLQFSVTDTGVGIPQERHVAIFEAFTQADSSTTRHFGGSGLGLSIVRHLARELGGDVRVRSEPGQGSTFTASIDPGDPPPAQPGTKVRPAKTDAEVLVDLKGRRILVVDDAADNRRLMTSLLGRLGAVVDLAVDGMEGLEMAVAAQAESQSYDVVLMDMQMPVLDGYQATRRLRDQGYTNPIVALTAHAMSEDRQRCLDAGCDNYLTKPLRRARMLEALTPLLGQATD